VRLLLFFALAISSFAQIRDIVTTQDGSRVYFVSTVKLRDSEESLASKLFMIDSTGAYLLDDEGTVQPGEDYSNVSKPSVTADGLLVIETSTLFCNSGNPCLYGDLSKPRTPPGMTNPFLANDVGGAVISRSGRYAGLYNNAVLTFPAAFPPMTVIDFSTGIRTELAPTVSLPVQVTSNGVVLAGVYNNDTTKLSLIDIQSHVTTFNPAVCRVPSAMTARRSSTSAAVTIPASTSPTQAATAKCWARQMRPIRVRL
jgi:hypothetical protein